MVKTAQLDIVQRIKMRSKVPKGKRGVIVETVQHSATRENSQKSQS